MGTNDFVIDCWMYLDEAMGTFRGIASHGGGQASWSVTDGYQWAFFILSDSKIYFQQNASGSPESVVSTSTISVNGVGIILLL